MTAEVKGKKNAALFWLTLGTRSGEQIAADKLTKIAEENWSTEASRHKVAFNPSIVDSVYDTELHGKRDTPPRLKRIMLLEISQYLESYLWPNFNPETASFQHIMSIICMVGLPSGLPRPEDGHTSATLLHLVHLWRAGILRGEHRALTKKTREIKNFTYISTVNLRPLRRGNARINSGDSLMLSRGWRTG
jgi:Intron-binding protein aquarius N-terminus